MGKSRHTIFTCDRCGHAEAEPDYKATKNWFEAKSSTYQGDVLLMCRPCWTLFVGWIKEARKDRMTKDDAEWNF